jgi:hypothetical protein
LGGRRALLVMALGNHYHKEQTGTNGRPEAW